VLIGGKMTTLLADYEIDNHIENQLKNFVLDLEPVKTANPEEWHRIRPLWINSFNKIDAMPFLENTVPIVVDAEGDVPPAGANASTTREWNAKRNNFRIKSVVNRRKDASICHAVYKALSGDAQNYLRSAQSAHLIWTNLNSSFQRTASETSQYAEKEWRSLDIKNFKNYPELMGHFNLKLKTLQEIRVSLREDPLPERDIVQQFFRALSTDDWRNQKAIWVGKRTDDPDNTLSYWDNTCQKHYQTFLIDAEPAAPVVDVLTKSLKRTYETYRNPNYKGKNYDPNYKSRKVNNPSERIVRQTSQPSGNNSEARVVSKKTEFQSQSKDDADKLREIAKYSSGSGATSEGPKGRVESRKNDVCRRCGKKGHWQRDCRVKLVQNKVFRIVKVTKKDESNLFAPGETLLKSRTVVIEAKGRGEQLKAHAKDDLYSVDC